MDFSVGRCSDSWCVSPSNIGSGPEGPISYSEDWRQNVPGPPRSSELQNQEDGPTSQVISHGTMHEEQSSPNAIDERASQSQCPTDNGPNRAARRSCGLRRFHAPCRSSESFSRPTHTVCDLGPLPICGSSIRNYRFQGLVGPYPHDAPWGDADSDGDLLGHLRRCCLGASQGEDRICIRCCSSSVMAPDCNHHLNRCVDFS